MVLLILCKLRISNFYPKKNQTFAKQNKEMQSLYFTKRVKMVKYNRSWLFGWYRFYKVDIYYTVSI